MKNPQELIGKKVRGFKFQKHWNREMKSYIGLIGHIIRIYENNMVSVEFVNGISWSYPADQIEAHLVDDEIPTFTKEDLREAYKIGFNLIMSKSRKESDKHFERWYQKRFEPTKEEKLTAILGSSEKVSEIMELFKN